MHLKVFQFLNHYSLYPHFTIANPIALAKLQGTALPICTNWSFFEPQNIKLSSKHQNVLTMPMIKPQKKNSSKRIVIPTTIIVLLYDFILIFIILFIAKYLANNLLHKNSIYYQIVEFVKDYKF